MNDIHIDPYSVTQSTHLGKWERSGSVVPKVLDSRPKGRGFEPHPRHCVVSLSKNINPSLVLVQPRKTRPFITKRLLMGRKESNRERSGSVVECSTRDRRAAGSSLTGVTALWSLSKTHLS